ncbi:TonB-dependent receptor [Sphingomonas sp. Leaf412]|uniref:TonB-dependent receptor domain-containing protein n=1 Tax=Sphingomonas sp. Leaf412 TaxID=1736370 RepID=UPI0006FB4287|nr:TonB-dependent receptor [Sphingomonas sp. Leaf412]KQT32043.1 TonB-dependent receptor [Sphingomonas sp. Leaf412]
MIKSKSALLGSAASAFAAMALFAGPALAQTTPEAGVGPVEGQIEQASSDGEPASSSTDLVVTGSRLRSPNLESASPITVLSAVELKQTGTTRVEDLVNSLPQVFAGQNAGYSNGSSGTATINLRGLGSERNLVLVNGRRLMPGDPGSSAADINAIPGAIIKRVDVLTGGASSVYGADAVTGVVNFVLDTDFEGLRLDGQYSFYNHNNRAGGEVQRALSARGFGAPDGQVADGGTVDATIAFGTKFDDDRGHITAYAGYRKINAVTQDRRDYSACALGQSTAAQRAAGFGRYNCGGSATSANGTFFTNDATLQVGPGSTFIPGSTPFNFAPTNYFQRPDERYTAGFFASYEVSEAVKPYAEFMFMDDRTVAQIAPSGNFGNTFSINCDNPLLSAQQRAIVCAPTNLLTAPDGSVEAGVAPFNFIDPVSGANYQRGFLQPLRRNVEGGPRRDDLQHTSYRVVAGVRGDISPVWNYDAFFQYGRTNFAETYFNDFSVSRLGRSLDVINGPSGAPICRSAQAGGEDPNCVPYNIFANGGVTAEALNYLQVPGFQRGINGETVINGSVTGQLGEYGIKSPFAADGLGIVLGGEYRRETLDFFSDVTFQTGDLAGQGAPTLPVAGKFDVKEFFAEARLPIVNDGFFHDLTVTGGYRYSSYENSAGGSFNTDTYKIEGEFAPIRDIRFRGGYNRAVRAPTVQDLFAPNRVALNGATDPCAGFVITAADVGCIAQGLTVGQTVAANPAAQYNGLIGGNSNLLPEIADTYTAGVVLQPSFLRGFALSVDYFDIKLTGAIGGIGQDTILDICTTSADPFFCGLINRDQFGSLWRSNNGFVVDTTQNIGGLSTRGIDVNASYTVGLGSAGNVALSFVGTYLDEIKTDPGVSDEYDCAGLYGNICGTPNPKWRHQARASYTSPEGLGVSLRWRYFDSVLLDTTALGGTVTPANRRLPVQNYFDLSFTARIAENYNFRIGANNLLDKEPPLTTSQNCPAGACNGNTWPGVYDALGRYIYAGVTLDF